MQTPPIRYRVVAPSYHENSGGTIFLHELVHALRSKGEDAAVVPMEPVYRRRLIKRLFTPEKPTPYLTDPKLDTPVDHTPEMTPTTVAMYPEMVRGNPLGAPHVARWLLYTPGKRHPFEFTENEMFFRVDEFADLPDLTGGAPDLFMWKVNRTYHNENRPDRKGACFIVRKWRDGPRHPVTENAIQLDGMSHAEINEIFNRCDTFYSYDDATMYSQYAAIAGCLSVVIPSGEGSRDEMLANHMLGRYGIAYGFEDEKIAHARATAHLVQGLLEEREAAGLATVDRFIEITKARVAQTPAATG